jgi:hypothetical protein
MPRAVPKYAWMPPSKAAFNALHRAHHDSEVRAISILSIELWSHVLSSLPLSLSPPGKTCWPLQKWKCMTTCSLSRIKFFFFFYCNIFGLESFIELILFFNFIPWYLIFISNLVLIL